MPLSLKVACLSIHPHNSSLSHSLPLSWLSPVNQSPSPFCALCGTARLSENWDVESESMSKRNQVNSNFRNVQDYIVQMLKHELYSVQKWDILVILPGILQFMTQSREPIHPNPIRSSSRPCLLLRPVARCLSESESIHLVLRSSVLLLLPFPCISR